MAEEKEEKREIPEKFRASLDTKDEQAFARLQEADAKQKALAESMANFRTLFTGETVKNKERQKAFVTIETLENPALSITEPQKEQLAEAYASIGFYDKAAELTNDQERCEEYLRYWEAVWLDDEDWCKHADDHKYIKDNIFSVKDEMERPLLACNACGTLNVADAPRHLTDAQNKRSNVRRQVPRTENNNYTIQELRQAHDL